jgi:hypothetical protein
MPHFMCTSDSLSLSLFGQAWPFFLRTGFAFLDARLSFGGLSLRILPFKKANPDLEYTWYELHLLVRVGFSEGEGATWV